MPLSISNTESLNKHRESINKSEKQKTENFLGPLLKLIIHGDRLLTQRNEPEDMACFGAVFLVEVVDDCRVLRGSQYCLSIATRRNIKEDSRVVARLSNITIVRGCQRTRAWKSWPVMI